MPKKNAKPRPQAEALRPLVGQRSIPPEALSFVGEITAQAPAVFENVIRGINSGLAGIAAEVDLNPTASVNVNVDVVAPIPVPGRKPPESDQ